MSDLLTLGAMGLRAHGRALATVSDNIANTQTPGYARRSIRLAEAPPGGSVLLYRNQANPGGVEVSGVTRAVDAWRIEDARTAGADSGQTAARLNWISATERNLDDGPDGIGQNITRIFNVADQLTSNPSSQPLRANFIQAVDDAAGAFRRTASALDATANGILADAGGQVEALNSDLTALERVNVGLRRAREGSTNQATLLDERDQLIDQIAARLPVSATFDARGVTTLTVAGPSGAALLSGGIALPIALNAAPGGLLSFTDSLGSPLMPRAGSLAGLANAASHVSLQQANLNGLASQFTAELNAAHQAGIDANGNPGAALLSFGGNAAALFATPLSPASVAAADSAGSNGNMLAMNGLRGSNGVEAGWANLVNTSSTAVASARAQDAAASSRRDGADAARDAVSAVDLDQEAADLLRFQQAYEASARVIQVARETIQAIMNVF
jgi:flagellar hook-associated protein 1